MGGGASKRGPSPAPAPLEAQPSPQSRSLRGVTKTTTTSPDPTDIKAAINSSQGSSPHSDFEIDYRDKLLDELSDDEVEREFDPRAGLDDANRQSWEMISNSLGMDGDDLLYNMLYFGDGAQNVGLAINSAIEETVALHSEHNTPYKLQPASQEEVESLAAQSYGVMSPRVSQDSMLDVPSKSRVCLVCRDELTLQCVVVKLPRCAHVFHDDCLKKWLNFQNWCPICRTDIASSDGKMVPSDGANNSGIVHKGRKEVCKEAFEPRVSSSRSRHEDSDYECKGQDVDGR